MTLGTFQLACLPVLAVGYGFRLRLADRPRTELATILLLAVAALVGEASCIAMYRFYGYAEAWRLKVGAVPILVPLIWPLVILSAREIAGLLAPRRGRALTAVAVFAVVCFDASLIEVVAVRAGYWAWAEPGYLAVPVIGILGWGFFGGAASFWLDLTEGRPPARALLPVVAVAATHALLVAAWWGGGRWVLRGDLGPWAVAGFAPIAFAAAVLALRRRGHARLLRWTTSIPRIVATALFLALLALLGPFEQTRLLWAHTALVALPYLCLVDYRVAKT